MRILTIILFLLVANSVAAEEKQWWVSVSGDNMQLAEGAAGTKDVVKGVYLDDDFVGKEMYVRIQQGYELDQFRQEEQSSTETAVVTTMEADSVAASSEPEADNNSEFGPLTDSGLQYYVNGDFQTWDCAKLFVTPLGERLYKLRCKEDMRKR